MMLPQDGIAAEYCSATPKQFCRQCECTDGPDSSLFFVLWLALELILLQVSSCLENKARRKGCKGDFAKQGDRACRIDCLQQQHSPGPTRSVMSVRPGVLQHVKAWVSQ